VDPLLAFAPARFGGKRGRDLIETLAGGVHPRVSWGEGGGRLQEVASARQFALRQLMVELAEGPFELLIQPGRRLRLADTRGQVRQLGGGWIGFTNLLERPLRLGETVILQRGPGIGEQRRHAALTLDAFLLEALL